MTGTFLWRYLRFYCIQNTHIDIDIDIDIYYDRISATMDLFNKISLAENAMTG